MMESTHNQGKSESISTQQNIVEEQMLPTTEIITETSNLIAHNSNGFFTRRNRAFMNYLQGTEEINKAIKHYIINTKPKKIACAVGVQILLNMMRDSVALINLAYSFGTLTCSADPNTGRCTDEELQRLTLTAVRICGLVNIPLLLISLSEKLVKKYRLEYWNKGLKIFSELAATTKSMAFNTLFLQELILSFKFPNPEVPTYISNNEYIGGVFIPAAILGFMGSSDQLLHLIKKAHPNIFYNPILKTIQNGTSEVANSYAILSTINMWIPKLIPFSVLRYSAISVGGASMFFTGVKYCTDANNACCICTNFLWDFIYHKLLSVPMYVTLLFAVSMLLKEYALPETFAEFGIYFAAIYLLELANTYFSSQIQEEHEETEDIYSSQIINRIY